MIAITPEVAYRRPNDERHRLFDWLHDLGYHERQVTKVEVSEGWIEVERCIVTDDRPRHVVHIVNRLHVPIPPALEPFVTDALFDLAIKSKTRPMNVDNTERMNT